MAAPAVDDVPLLVRVLAGNPATGASILSCLTAVDTRPLRRLHVAVAGAVAGVPWADTATRVADTVRWRAALPGAVGARLVEGHLFSDAVVAALAGVTHLDLSGCYNVSDEVLRRLPPTLRTLNVRGCSLTERASIAHLSALEVLNCSETGIAAAGLPPSLQELNISIFFAHNSLAGVSLAHLTRLRVLHVAGANLDDAALALLPPSLVTLDVELCTDLTAEASFARLAALQSLHAANSSLCDASLMTLPPSLVYLDVRGCNDFTHAATLPPLPALRTLDVSDSKVGDALVASLPAGLTELRMVQCRGVTARVNFDHVPVLQALYSMGTALDPAVAVACRTRGCDVPAAGEVHGRGYVLESLVALAVGVDHGQVWLWDVAAGGGVKAVLRATGRVSALAPLPDGRRLAVGVWDSRMAGHVQVWDIVRTPPAKMPSIPCDKTLLALAVLTDGCVAAGCDDGSVWIVDVEAGAVLAVLAGNDDKVTALTALPNGALAVGSWDGTVRLWDVGRTVCVAKLEGHIDGVQSLAVLADGRLAAGTAGGVVALWDVGSRTRVGELVGYCGQVTVLAALPDGRLVAGSDQGVIQLWDTRRAAAAAMAGTGRPASTVSMTVLAKMPEGTRVLAPLPDGRLACTCEYAHKVYLLAVPPPTVSYRYRYR